MFFYPQLNLAGGYDSDELGDGFGLADRGPRSQATMEWFIKDRDALQLGYTRLIRPDAYNAKFGVELDPSERYENRAVARFRLYDVFARFSSKWDRTWLWLGHKSIPYGHNPALDPQFSFLPNQAGLDLGFTRDTGAFFQTPVNDAVDLELSATLGKGDTFDYRGGWLVSSRLGSPTFRADELGVFVVGGRIPRTSGTRTVDASLTSIARVGIDWIHKRGERAKIVNQVSAGTNDGMRPSSDKSVLNALNTFEWFPLARWNFGLTHALRAENPRTGSTEVSRGEFLATISYAVTRDVRFRVNPFVAYRDVSRRRDEGVLAQLCFNCGLIK